MRRAVFATPNDHCPSRSLAKRSFTPSGRSKITRSTCAICAESKTGSCTFPPIRWNKAMANSATTAKAGTRNKIFFNAFPCSIIKNVFQKMPQCPVCPKGRFGKELSSARNPHQGSDLRLFIPRQARTSKQHRATNRLQRPFTNCQLLPFFNPNRSSGFGILTGIENGLGESNGRLGVNHLSEGHRRIAASAAMQAKGRTKALCPRAMQN